MHFDIRVPEKYAGAAVKGKLLIQRQTQRSAKCPPVRGELRPRRNSSEIDGLLEITEAVVARFESQIVTELKTTDDPVSVRISVNVETAKILVEVRRTKARAEKKAGVGLRER